MKFSLCKDKYISQLNIIESLDKHIHLWQIDMGGRDKVAKTIQWGKIVSFRNGPETTGKLLHDSGNSYWSSLMTQRDRKGYEVGGKVQEGRDICIPMANSLGCMAETKSTLLSNYPSIKNIKRNSPRTTGYPYAKINK